MGCEGSQYKPSREQKNVRPYVYLFEIRVFVVLFVHQQRIIPIVFVTNLGGLNAGMTTQYTSGSKTIPAAFQADCGALSARG